ncbi:MAG: dihydropteroate synthase [Holophagales bacterium]|nr:dihydropteroate synthase [Holophagales bacterium]
MAADSTPAAEPASLPLPGAGGRLVLGGSPKVMGILNITPDSFSDGGLFLEREAAVRQGLSMAEAGADLLDLGAESTRPGGGVYGAGCVELEPAEELARLLPVLAELRRRLPQIPISVDTRKGPVAEAALDAGADLINDVGGLRDPGLRAVVAGAGCAVVAMHSRGELSTMQRNISFRNVVTEVKEELAATLELARTDGIPPSRVLLDPGIGFGKAIGHNLSLLRHLRAIRALGCPLLVGASRKSFISSIHQATPTERLPGSLAALAWAASAEAEIVRVHDVAESRQFLGVWSAIHSA